MSILFSSVLTIVLAVIYSALIYYRQREKFWDWLNTLSATALSFFLALVAGIYLFNQQAIATGKASQEDLRRLLGAEMSDDLRILNDPSRMSITFPSGKKTTVLITFVQPLVIEKAALSGLFTVSESENLLHIARKMRMLNLKIEYFLGLVQSRANEATFMHAITNIEETRLANIAGIKVVANQLNIELSEKYPD